MLVLPELPIRIPKQCRKERRQQVGKKSWLFYIALVLLFPSLTRELMKNRRQV